MTDIAAETSIAWSSFSPEIAMVVAVVVLLALTVAGRRRMWVATPLGLAITGAGMAMLNTADLGFVAVVTMAAGLFLVAGTYGLAPTPRILHACVAGVGAGVALLLSGWLGFVVIGGDLEMAARATMGGSLALDGVAVFTRFTVYLTTLLVIPMGHSYLDGRGLHRPEFEPLLLLSATGMALFGAANDLITMFVALEVLSIALYVLTGSARRDRRSQEAATKYFVLGAVASAILLYGFALTYVATGSLELSGIAAALGNIGTPLRVSAAGLVLVVIGIGFKVSLAPLQLWTPDVYQGAPSNITAFMGAATKAAAFAAMLRLLLVAFLPLRDLWLPVVAVMAAASMLYGAYAALRQNDVKRLLAYSAIAHAGYATIGIVATSDDGLSATLWYLMTYAITTLAAFGVLIAIERTHQRLVTVADLRGLGRTSPVMAAVFSVALLSLAGIPPTIGFAGKLAVFSAGIASGWIWLVVVGVVSSVVAAAYYLRLMVVMYIEEPGPDAVEPTFNLGWTATVTAAALAVVLGLLPNLVVDIATRAAGMVQ